MTSPCHLLGCFPILCLLAVLHPVQLFHPTCIFLAALLSSPSSVRKEFKRGGGAGGEGIQTLASSLIALLTESRIHPSSFWTSAILKTLITSFIWIIFSKDFKNSPPKMDVYLSLLFLKSLCPGTWQNVHRVILCVIHSGNIVCQNYKGSQSKLTAYVLLKNSSICYQPNWKAKSCQANAKGETAALHTDHIWCKGMLSLKQ